jgi:hypothetical protein
MIRGLQYKIYKVSPLWVRRIYFSIRFKKSNNTVPEKIEFGVPLVEHCNLRCKGCDHFSPVAEKSEIDIRQLENDMRRLSVLWGGANLKDIFAWGRTVTIFGIEPCHADMS